jgi:lysophospholipase
MTFDRRALPAGAAIGEWRANDGWPHRTLAWISDADRGSILFLGGRGDIFEKYLEAFDHWHRAGWSVASFDWRGQGGSGRLSQNPSCGHASSFAPFIDDLAAYVEQWRKANPAPHVIVAHSMGGHLTLRALAEDRVAPDAAVLVAPMLGLKSQPFGAKVAAKVAALMCRIGKPERLAWKVNERPGVPMKGRRALLTHDEARYEDELWWKAHNPEIAVGPPSWAWVAEAYRSTLALEEPCRLERMTTPVLLLAAENDRLVDSAAILRAAKRLPNAKLRTWGPESAHEILREADPVRDAALAEIDRFLDTHAPRP